MGISIHYTGILKRPSELSELTRKLIHIAAALYWPSTIVATPDVNGIVISPPNCEPLSFCFDPDGNTRGIGFLNDDRGSDEHYTTIHTKTQYAGPEIHKAIIDILVYLSRK